MPKRWSDKDERQYQHVKKSEQQRGKSVRRAKAIAARTVNKQRRGEGRTASTTSQGAGNSNARLEDRTVVDLRNRASELGVNGRSKMKKGELISAIRSAQ